mmetsp:Transcript_22538/g.62627  ORF Transcript_22538/g.62627 Transcript_22538/m.62627 type:complete len:361 (-) Transcript_22538:2624-3706(-)
MALPVPLPSLAFAAPTMPPTMSPPDEQRPNDGLSQVYWDMAQKSVDANWPLSDKIRSFFDPHPDSGFTNQPPVFPGDEGPIGMFCFFDAERGYNVEGIELVQDCVALFSDFCRTTLPQHLGPSSSPSFEEDVQPYIVECKASHIAVAIFQENARLMASSTNEKQTNDLLAVSSDQVQELVNVLLPAIDSSTQQSTKIHDVIAKPNEPNKDVHSKPIETSLLSIMLELDSIIWTADGALIAGFVDKGNVGGEEDKEATEFLSLRQNLIRNAKTVLPSLTSRPKNLIHVTLGRVLGFSPDEANVSELIQRYNTHVWPQKVKELRHKHRGGFPLSHITLHRNTVWLCEEGKYYATWKFRERTS